MKTIRNWGRFQQQRPNDSKPGKWPLKTQARFCQLLADQLASGFSLKQAIRFLRTVAGDFPASLAVLERDLVGGQEIVALLAPYLQPNVYLQLQLSATYGELEPALRHAATILQLLATQRQRLRQLMAYPLGLFGGMAALFATLKLVILPQLQQEIGPTPLSDRRWQAYVIIGGGLLGILGLWGAWRWWRQQSPLVLAQWYIRLPGLGAIFRSYYAYYLSTNLSQLVQSGLSVKQMMAVLQQLSPQSLLYQLAIELNRQLTVGQSPTKWLQRQLFIPPQLVVFLRQGRTTPQLARELQAFSALQYQELLRRIERGMAIVQPVLLAIVALLIVAAYLSLLLPMYQNLQGVYNG